MWLLDTVTVCEPTKSTPKAEVLDWLSAQADSALHTSVICIGEIRRGVERLDAGAKRIRLTNWLEKELSEWFGHRILPIDTKTAHVWGQLSAGRTPTIPVEDGLIAATAMQHGLTVVTRNVKHFSACGVEVFDPWGG